MMGGSFALWFRLMAQALCGLLAVTKEEVSERGVVHTGYCIVKHIPLSLEVDRSNSAIAHK